MQSVRMDSNEPAPVSMRPDSELLDDLSCLMTPRRRLEEQRYNVPRRPPHPRRQSDVFDVDLNITLKPSPEQGGSPRKRGTLRIQTHSLFPDGNSFGRGELDRERGTSSEASQRQATAHGLPSRARPSRKTSIKVKEALKRGWTPSLKTNSDETCEPGDARLDGLSPLEAALTRSFLDHRPERDKRDAQTPSTALSPTSPSPDRRTRRRAETLAHDTASTRTGRGFLGNLLRLKKSDNALRTRKHSPIEEKVPMDAHLNASSPAAPGPDEARGISSAYPATPSKTRSFASIFTGKHTDVARLGGRSSSRGSPSQDSAHHIKSSENRQRTGPPLRLVTSHLLSQDGPLSAPATMRHKPIKRETAQRSQTRLESVEPESADTPSPFSPFSISHVAKSVAISANSSARPYGTPIAPFSDLVKLLPSTSNSALTGHDRAGGLMGGLSPPPRAQGVTSRRSASPSSQSSSSAVKRAVMMQHAGGMD